MLLSQVVGATGNSRCSLTCRGIIPISVSIFTWPSRFSFVSVYLKSLPSLIRKLVIDLGPTVSIQGFPDSSVSKESICYAGDPSSIPGSGRSAVEGKGYPLQYSRASLVAQLVKNPPEGDLGSIPGLGRSPGEGNGNSLQYSGLENSMDFIVHGVAKSQTRLSNFHFHFSHYNC